MIFNENLDLIFIFKKVDKKLLSNKLLAIFYSKFETKIGFIFYIKRDIYYSLILRMNRPKINHVNKKDCMA